MKRIPQVWRSYHFRMMAAATLLSGAMVVSMAAVYARGLLLAERTRLDTEIRELSLMQLSQPLRSAEDWDELEQRLQLETPQGAWAPMLLVRSGDGGEVYRSPRWKIAGDAREVLGAEEIRELFAEFKRSNRVPALRPLEGAPPPPPPTLSYATWRDEAGREWRVGVTGTPEFSLAVAMDWTARKAGYNRMATLLMAGLPMLLVLLGGISFYLSNRALRPIRELQAAAERITVRGLDERLDASHASIEFAGLIQVFNQMLDRLERSFRIANEFSAGAAHELKTPLAVLQGELERGVQESAPGSEEQERYGRLVEQVQRVKTITHKLLLLATVDAGALRLRMEPFDLSECVRDACDDAAVLAPDISQELHIPDGIMVMADPELLPNVVTNLVVNAIVHNEPEGRIGVRIKTTPNRVRLTVKNTGPDIPKEEHARLFTRFYRMDKSRSRAHGGSGLGLSLARDIARAHGGDVFLVDTLDSFNTFELVLPLLIPKGGD